MGKQRANVVQRVRTVGVARNASDLPRRELGVDVFGELFAFFAELLDFVADIHRRLVLHIAQFLDFFIKFGNRLLKIEKVFFAHGVCSPAKPSRTPNRPRAADPATAKYTKLPRCGRVPRPEQLRAPRCG